MAGINALIQKLERMGRAEVTSRIAAKVADVAHAQCIQGFREQRDPYGLPWARRKPPKAWAVKRYGIIDNGHPLLDDTGAMINSLTARASGERVLMRIKGYAKFHQSGTKNMAQRMIFPEPARGLGLWGAPINAAALAAVRELVAG